MKMLSRILGVLLLLGGLALAGLLLTGEAVPDAQKYVTEATQKVKTAEDEVKFSQSSEAKTNFETARQSLNTFEGLLKERKQSRLIGLVISGLLAVVGIGIFGLSFIFGRKKIL